MSEEITGSNLTNYGFKETKCYGEPMWIRRFAFGSLAIHRVKNIEEPDRPLYKIVIYVDGTSFWICEIVLSINDWVIKYIKDSFSNNDHLDSFEAQVLAMLVLTFPQLVPTCNKH